MFFWERTKSGQFARKRHKILEIEENFISKGCFEKFVRFYMPKFIKIRPVVPKLERSLALIGNYLIGPYCGNFNYYEFWIRPHPSIRKCRHFFCCLKFYLETCLSCCAVLYQITFCKILEFIWDVLNTLRY